MSALAASGIVAAFTVVAFAAGTATDQYELTLKDYVPVKDKGKFQQAMKKGKNKDVKWKDEQGKEAPMSAILDTTGAIVSTDGQQAQPITIGSNVTYQFSFNSSSDLKALVETLQ